VRNPTLSRFIPAAKTNLSRLADALALLLGYRPNRKSEGEVYADLRSSCLPGVTKRYLPGDVVGRFYFSPIGLIQVAAGSSSAGKAVFAASQRNVRCRKATEATGDRGVCCDLYICAATYRAIDVNFPALSRSQSMGVRKMAMIARLLSMVFPEVDERSDDKVPVLMFTAIALMVVICFVLMNGAPPPIEFQTF
jgi:hypothetical protein